MENIDTERSGPVARSRFLWWMLFVASALEVSTAVQDLFVYFGTTSNDLRSERGALLMSAVIAIKAVSAGVAICSLFVGRIAAASIALASVALLTWTTLLPSLGTHGILAGSEVVQRLSHCLGTAHLASRAVFCDCTWPDPIGCAARLAAHLCQMAGVLAVAVGVIVHGF